MSNQTLFGGLLIVAALLTASSSADAHLLLEEGASRSAGFWHPFTGIDHLLAMLTVGMWAAQQGGSRIWQLPVAFLSMMLLGGYAGYGGMALPAAETGVAGSVMVLGLLLCFAVRLPVSASLLLVGFFAVFHGYVHGAETPQEASAAEYAGGILLATALLHGLGIVTGLSLRGLHLEKALRIGGIAIGVAGGWLWM